MAVNRVSTFALFQSTLGNVAKVDAQLANLQNQLSSGFKSKDFEGISDNATRYMQLEDRLARMKQYSQTNSVVQTRIDTTDTILSQIISVATEIKNLISQRRSGTLESGAFAAQLDANWKTLVGQINTTVEGRYLFSGGRTDTPPMDADNFPELPVNGVPSDSYYAGDQQDITVRASDSVELTYNVRADEEGFKKIFGGLALAKQGDLVDSDELLEEGYDMMAEGLENIIARQATVNSNSVTLQNINQEIVSLTTYWQGIKDDIVNTDIITASTQVAINQSILTAAFQSFARITSLRLADFLR